MYGKFRWKFFWYGTFFCLHTAQLASVSLDPLYMLLTAVTAISSCIEYAIPKTIRAFMPKPTCEYEAAHGPDMVAHQPTVAIRTVEGDCIINMAADKTQKTPVEAPVTIISQKESPWSTTLLQNKQRVAISCVVAWYVYLNYSLIRYWVYLNNASRWFLWKSALPLAELVAIPRSVLKDELLAESVMRYHIQKSGTANDLVEKFLIDICQEQETLEAHRRMGARILSVAGMQKSMQKALSTFIWDRLPLLNMLPSPFSCLPTCKAFFLVSEETIHKTDEYLTRLNLFKAIVMEYFVSSEKGRAVLNGEKPIGAC